MTIANKITLFRFALIPIMTIIIYVEPLNETLSFFNSISIKQLVLGILFIIGSFSDFLDGYLARKLNQVTTFGKFLDPIADKVLVILALLYLNNEATSFVPLFVVVIVVLREFIVTAVRLVTAEKGIVISASIFGKIKTVTQMVAIILLFFNDFGIKPFYSSDFISLSLGSIILYVSVVAVILSGYDYVYKSRKYLFESI
ncbi:MAG: CDP-diacylglycerol--glycerol-3-phosphate 3-phosphatidyltransferase [Acholeplasmatales bacterium]|jgi:CDP-diacylglycerol--glycerol-3-phosphate 3-phosphatidyltransferase|nr:CDP-diacylglycerol--glycerol-3-phosphate 3-phosphatidyltransferase [Acholeplasmatales bacterium]